MKSTIALIGGMIVGAIAVSNMPKLQSEVSDLSKSVLQKLDEIKEEISKKLSKASTDMNSTSQTMESVKRKPQPKAI